MCEDGVSIHSWLLLHPSSRNERVPTIMFFHGNAGNIGLRLPNAIQMYQYLRANIMLVEYRGYGDSDDVTPSERGLKLDSEAALRFLSTYETVDPDRIFVFGRSLGGAVSFHLAQYAQQNGLPLAGVIVENTFLSISAMVDHLMPYIAPLKGLVLRIGWNSYRIAPRIQIPILYLSGGADQLVPPKHMRELYNMSLKSSRCARILIIKDGTHNETWLQGGREYWDKFRSFMAEAISGERRDSFRSTSAMEDVAVEDDKLPPFSASLGVGMGADTESSTASAIPTMPSNLVGMAREASQKSTSSKRTDSDVKKQI
jgi:pimeloyl-ACP methyl ester carboxylesterase